MILDILAKKISPICEPLLQPQQHKRDNYKKDKTCIGGVMKELLS